MTSHPPDEYMQQARKLLALTDCASDPVVHIAAALHDAYRRGAEEMRERARGACERMVVGGRAWTAEQALAAEVLFAARDEIAALALPTGPAAPASEHASDEEREHEERCAAARARPDVVSMLSDEEPLDTEPHAIGDVWQWGDSPSACSRVVRVEPPVPSRGWFEPRIALEGKGDDTPHIGWWIGQGWRRVRRGGGP